MPLQINCKLQSASELNIQIISVLTEPSRLNNGIRKKFTIENSIYIKAFRWRFAVSRMAACLTAVGQAATDL